MFGRLWFQIDWHHVIVGEIDFQERHSRTIGGHREKPSGLIFTLARKYRHMTGRNVHTFDKRKHEKKRLEDNVRWLTRFVFAS